MNRTPPPLPVATRAELFAHLASMEQSGLPADGLFAMGLKPDWVLSGVNAGGNLGQDIVISGTCATAREAAYHGVKAMAFSHYLIRSLAVDWDRIAAWTTELFMGQQNQPLANEHEFYSAGNSRLVVEWKGWKICPLICYDLRFPVWSRNKPITHHKSLTTHHISHSYDCLIYVANWPEARKTPWSKLLEARAIENQVYVVGVNRMGLDGKEISYSGNSAVIDPKGNIINNITENQNHIQTTELNREELDDFRTKFPVGLDGDDFEVFY